MMAEGGRKESCNAIEPPTAPKVVKLEYESTRSYKKKARWKHDLACESNEKEDL